MDEKLEENTLISLGKTNLQSRRKERKTNLHSFRKESAVISREWSPMVAKARTLKFRARDCNRRKDLLHLLFSYPAKPEADQADLLLLRDNFIELTRMTKRLDAMMEKGPHNPILVKLLDRDIPAVLEDVEHRLAKYAFDFDLSQVSPQSLTRMTERFDATMSVGSPCWDGQRSEDSDEGSKTSASKDRRGCYERRKTMQTWTKITPTLIDDGHAWRKYGQKEILNAKHPRNYFRCTHKFDQGCQATKQVQRTEDDPPTYRTIYHGHHTCKNLLKAPQIILDSTVSTTPSRGESSFVLSFGSANPSYKSHEPLFPTFPLVKQEYEEDKPSLDQNQSSSSSDYLVTPDPFESSGPMTALSSGSDDGEVISSAKVPPNLVVNPIDRDISAVNSLDFAVDVNLESPDLRVPAESSRLISGPPEEPAEWSRLISGPLINGPPEEPFQWAIDCAIFQILNCMKRGQLKVIGISGGDNAGKVTKTLEDLPEIRSMFEVVIGVSVSQCHRISEVQACVTEQIHRLVGTDISFPLDEARKPYKFLLILHCGNEMLDLHNLKIPEHGWVVLSTPGMNAYEIMRLDLEIKVNDLLLPWKLFWKNVDVVFVPSDIEVIGQRLIEACHNHLLAIVLLARALKHVTDIGVWEIALQELTSSSSELYSPVEGTSEVMVLVLKFVWERKSIITRHCMKHYATSVTEDGKLQISSLVRFMRKNALTEIEVCDVLNDLVDSFLLEMVSNDCHRMRKETRDVLLSHFIPQLNPLYLHKQDLGLSEAPEVAEWDAMTINLSNNLLSEVPEKPKCPSLLKLLLQKNYDLLVVPSLFFECMPKLQVLDLSYTSIKSLPSSISRLVSLQEFFLRGCELFTELPPEVGELSNLLVFDLEGTKITNLPCEMKKLTKLACLKVSFCGYRNICKEGKQINKRIPMGLLSGLFSLELLSIDVNPEDKDWIGDVENFMFDLHKLRLLRTVKLYLPEIRLLKEIEDVKNFKFIVGHHEERIISCVPHAVEEEFEKQENYLKYINGESIPTEIQNALRCTRAFFLERHWNVRKLSEFGNENMVELKFCLLVECNELQTIIDAEFCAEGDHKFVDKKPILGSLQYLGIHRMMKLRSIWEGPIDKWSLSRLKFLALHECPSLITIFTLSLLGNLYNLEELIVEDCSKINSLVTRESSCFESNQLLPNLKKLSLLDLLELADISSGLCIAPKLERIIIYACPMIESLSPGELSCNNLEVIKGEIEWWSSLSWHEWSSTQQDYMASIFVELKRDASLMDQLAESGNSA